MTRLPIRAATAAVLIATLAACSAGPQVVTSSSAPLGAPNASATATPQPTPEPSPSPVPSAEVAVALPPPPEAPISAVVASPVVAAETRAPATPTPSPDPATWRVEGVILADDSKLPLKDVCIVIGPHGCQRGSVRTDSRGVFYFDVPQIPTVFYDLYFEKDGFWTVWMRIKPEGPSIYNVALTKR